MNLEIWLPAMFILGMALMGACFVVTILFEKI
jgi:hypothetical protein